MSGWELLEVDRIKRLQRVFAFDDFRVTVSWWRSKPIIRRSSPNGTHKIKGLHRNDFIMAAKTDELYGRPG